MRSTAEFGLNAQDGETRKAPAIKGTGSAGRSATMRVSRRESFNAAHQLCDPDLSDDENRRLYGKCVNLHGHNYVVEVVVTGTSIPRPGTSSI